MSRLTLPVLLLLAAPILSGCMHDGTNDGSGDKNGGAGHDRSERVWTNPYDFEVHFDGWRAYDDAMAQIYEDPEAKTGPRYRIPATATHDEVAIELHKKLDEPTRSMGGSAGFVRFSGARYYDLDLAPVSRYLCSEDDPARERVRDLEFTNIVGRTSNSEIGVIIGAHWDSKRHADPTRDPRHAGEPILAADDGAAGTAAVIELARAFAADEPDVALTFVLFDGEDGFESDDCHPLAGSLHYAQSLTTQEKSTVKGMILLDMVGNASAKFRHEGHSQTYTGSEGNIRSDWLIDAVWATASAMDVDAFEDRNIAQIADDHLPFLDEGLYAIDIIRFDNGFAPYWHTTRDDHTAIQPQGIDQVGAVVEATVRRLAETGGWGPGT